MRSLDTHPEAERVQIELLRQSPPWRKLHMVGQMNQAVLVLALSGLHHRYPQATSEDLHRRLVDLWLGAELAAQVYKLWNEEKEEVILSEPIAVTLLVIDALETLGISYLVGGSLASAVHGVLRATLDADLVADVRLEHAEPLALSLGDAFYANAEAIRNAVHRQSSFNVIHLKTMFKVDIFILKGRPFDKAQFARRIAQMVATDPERTAYVASAEDTILAKLEWYRLGGEVSERQWGDVLGMLKVQSYHLNDEYLRYWASQLNVADLLERAFSETGL